MTHFQRLTRILFEPASNDNTVKPARLSIDLWKYYDNEREKNHNFISFEMNATK